MQRAVSRKLWYEASLLFVALPIIMAFPISAWVKLVSALAAVIYVVATLYTNKQFNRDVLISLGNRPQWRRVLIKFGLFALVSTVLVAYFLPDKLFVVPFEYTLMWLAISVFYVVFSVYPQELIYRQFFFFRYRVLVEKESVFIALNAMLFCLAHLLFWNSIVLALTLAGGFLFAYTFSRSRSLMFTSIEHSFYGVWLFTLGIGEMLAFPMPAS